MVVEAAVCLIKKGEEVLFIMPSRGDSKGRWNLPGGKIEPGETPEDCAIREGHEETGLKINEVTKHGIIDCYVEGKGLFYRLHIFSANSFSGEPRATEEGELKWFQVSELPFSKMWPSDIIWIPLVLEGKKFDADFHYDAEKKKVLSHEIKLKVRV